MEWLQIIPWSLSFGALLVAFLTYMRNGKTADIKERQENDIRMEALKESLLKANVKLDQLCAMFTETRTDIKVVNTSLTEMDKRLSVVENDLKTAFMRIDEIREEVRHGMDKG